MSSSGCPGISTSSGAGLRNPDTPPGLWEDEFTRRFGAAAGRHLMNAQHLAARASAHRRGELSIRLLSDDARLGGDELRTICRPSRAWRAATPSSS